MESDFEWFQYGFGATKNYTNLMWIQENTNLINRNKNDKQ